MKNDSFKHTGCKRGWASRRLCVWASVRSVLFIGKSEFRFRRFNKGLRALAIRAKTHCLDQNRQSLGYIAHCSNHWANATNLTYKLLKQCGFNSWNAKKKLHCRNMLSERICNSHFWRWVRLWRYGSGQGWKLFVLFLSTIQSRNHSSTGSGAATPAQIVLWAPTCPETTKAGRMMMWVQTTMISCTMCYDNTYFSLWTL